LVQSETVWQIDFYRRPLCDRSGEMLWELIVCSDRGEAIAAEWCPQSQAGSQWLTEQLQQAIARANTPPDRLQLFRPQCQSLVEVAGKNLDLPVAPTRRTIALKKHLRDRAQNYPQMSEYTGDAYDPLALDRPPPVPVPDEYQGETWQFASVPASEIELAFVERPIPIRETPEFLLPIHLGVGSTQAIGGVVIYGGRQSMRLARWLQEIRPVCLNYIPGDPDGIILEAGLTDRWVLQTFEDPEVKQAAKTFQRRAQQAKGLHFLLVQPDDSGMTYSGVWLLQPA
jgi:hypothetical protein